MKKKERTRHPNRQTLKAAKGGTIIEDDIVVMKTPAETEDEGIIIEDNIILRNGAP